MKTEQIKQMAEAKAMEKYPVKIIDMDGYRYDQNESSRQIYAQAIIDIYKEQENNDGEKCVHKWKELWSGDPDSQSMEFEGEVCEKCGSNND